MNRENWLISKSISPQPIYTFQKDYPFNGDTIDVLVFIHETNEGFTISSSVEARVSGPYDNERGTTTTLEEALKRVKTICEQYDERYR